MDWRKSLQAMQRVDRISVKGGLGSEQRIKKEAKSLFSKESAQKSFLTALAIITIPLLTSLLIMNPTWDAGARTNMTTIIYLSCLYVFFQIFDRFVRWTVTHLLNLPLKTSFVLEFVKFFFAFLTTNLYMREFIVKPVFKIDPRPDSVFLFISNCIYASVAAAIFYHLRLVKDLAMQSKVAQAEAQYNLLENQMQPHFLFNSLNVLSELIYVDPDLANSMTQKMADLYREILTNSKEKYVDLESEVSILEKYIEIQKIRFGERIRFHNNVSPAFYNIQIPSLMLQTLVENAIKHGISPNKDGGEIFLNVEKVGNLFEICIANTGKLYKGHTSSKRSTGLQNTQHRLDLMYGQQHQFKIYSDEQKTYVKFRITGRSV